MLTRIILSAQRVQTVLFQQFRRNLGATAVVSQKAADPIQQLFLNKIHEYADKKKAAGGKLVDADAAVEKDLQDDLDKIARQYGAKGADFLNFPEFKFEDPELEPLGVKVEVREAKKVDLVDIDELEEETKTAEKTYWQV